MKRTESAIILRRREKSGLNAAQAALPVSGLALSGGGIRSATFCLGMLQAVAAAGLLAQIDFLSTASGGGYIGSFVGAWINRPGESVMSVEKKLPQSSGQQVGYLRENGRYIAPNGSGDLWAEFATVLRSWVAILFVLGVFAFALFLLGALARQLLWDLSQARPTFLPIWIHEPATPQWLWPSVWWAVAAAVAGVLVAPLVIAFWLLGETPRKLDPITGAAVLALVLAGAWFAGRRMGVPGVPFATVAIGAGPWFLLGILVCLVAWSIAFAWAARTTDLAPPRRWLTNVLAAALGVFVGLVLYGLVDTLAASWLQKQSNASWGTTAVHAGIAAAIAAAKFIWPIVSKSFAGTKRASIPQSVSAGLGAVLLALVLLTVLDYWALMFAKALGAQSVLGNGSGCPELKLLLSALLLLGFCIVIGHPLGLVNLSSLHQMYTARITRAYVGASNPARFDPLNNRCGQNITEPIAGDDFEMADYRPYEHGGPVHLINATVNETISGRSQIEQRDRGGMGMAVGPAGISLGRVHHAMFVRPDSPSETGPAAENLLRHETFHNKVRVFPIEPPAGSVSVMGSSASTGDGPAHRVSERTGSSQARTMERLPLGGWVGVSGAAFSTGMGAQTSIGLSFLAGIFNVRLGYWWDSGLKACDRRDRTRASWTAILGGLVTDLFPAQMVLCDELLARFHGTALRYWYLSDGGHFENTAAYELIRRRVPIIIVCDCGADPGYAFEDVGNLVRKARIDFQAEIVFTDPAAAKAQGMPVPDCVGTLDQLRQNNPLTSLGSTSAKHSALAFVYYDDKATPDSVMLIVKPTMTGREPPDLLNYRSTHELFPQEPTAEQFFDEAQWESYRKLGELIGSDLFPAATGDARWLWAPLKPVSRVGGGVVGTSEGPGG